MNVCGIDGWKNGWVDTCLEQTQRKAQPGYSTPVLKPPPEPRPHSPPRYLEAGTQGSDSSRAGEAWGRSSFKNWPGVLIEKPEESPSVHPSASFPTIIQGTPSEALLNPADEAEPLPLYKHTQPTALLIWALIKQPPSQFPGHTGNSFVAGADTSGLPVYQTPRPAQFSRAHSLSHSSHHLLTHLTCFTCPPACAPGEHISAQKQRAVGTSPHTWASAHNLAHTRSQAHTLPWLFTLTPMSLHTHTGMYR